MANSRGWVAELVWKFSRPIGCYLGKVVFLGIQVPVEGAIVRVVSVYFDQVSEKNTQLSEVEPPFQAENQPTQEKSLISLRFMLRRKVS